MGKTVGLSDATHLLNLTDDSVVDNLGIRYAADEIHTFVGTVLLVLNPYRKLPIYEEPERFYGVRLVHAPPHVFAVGEEAYLLLRREGVSQALVISGQSGAGKTETTKLLVRYIAERARASPDMAPSKLSEALVRSNPSLEAFGNASTTRNSNSSRFAKFTRLHVAPDGSLQRAAVVTYLLEKSRVTLHATGERNFHIFYLMIDATRGPDGPRWTQALHIKEGSRSPDFNYLRSSTAVLPKGAQGGPVLTQSQTQAAGPTDLEDTLQVLASSGVSIADSTAVCQLVAAVLHLGQASFSSRATGDGASLVHTSVLLPVEKLLGVADISPLLLERRLTLPGADDLVIQLTPTQAIGARDALARALFELAFHWLVKGINRGLGGLVDNSPFIGLLDVFGFEDFALNSFEQLCINFANERLQQLLVERLFKAEIKLYTSEGVPVPGGAGSNSYADNLGCVEMLSGSPSGIFRLLDSQCISPQATDAKFIGSVNAEHGHSAFLKPAGARGARNDEKFVVRHYAGEVIYSGTGFVQKNSDALDSHCAKALALSTEPFIRAIIEFGATRDDAAKHSRGKHSRGGGLGGGGGAVANSLGRRFIGELETLLKTLNAGGCHFIRCVAPSGGGGIGKARAFDKAAVMRQLSNDGTFDAVRMLKHGYPVRLPFAQLHARFLPLLAPASPQVGKLDPSQFAELLAAVVGVRPSDCALGSSKIFLRGDAAIAFDELRFKDTQDVLVVLSAKMAEWEAKERAGKALAPRLIGWYVRVRYIKMRKGAILIQARVRGVAARVRGAELHRVRQMERLAARQQAAAEAAEAAKNESVKKAQEAAEALRPPERNRRSSLEITPEKEREAGIALDALAEYVRNNKGGYTDADAATSVGGSTEPPTRDATPRQGLNPSADAELRAQLAKLGDYNLIENEMRTLVAKQRAEDAAQQAGLTPRAHGHQELLERHAERHAALRQPQSWITARAGSLELIVLEEGSALPVFRRILKREELNRLRWVFDEWDMDHDGVVSLSEFFVVMQLLAGKASKSRTMQASSVEDMFSVADVNGDGSLAFPEFVLFSFGELTRSSHLGPASLVLHTSAAAKLIGGGVNKTAPSPGNGRKK